ncbi:hypothetical protein [Paracoccus sp. (in: a-proteobacteria)]|uniref:hypothetical protein n=1 Tax=Paracoccus sp. TaxID=267 RepID=UPI00289B70D0|nr:hypothetical protein [Paracoccus sp. (in: a-proteobacteria)]
MGLIEFVCASIIAAYAMVGGAFIGASITAPHNMKKVLIAMDPAIGVLFPVTGLGMIASMSLIFIAPFGWFIKASAIATIATAAHLTFTVIYAVCHFIVAAIDDPESQQAVKDL